MQYAVRSNVLAAQYRIAIESNEAHGVLAWCVEIPSVAIAARDVDSAVTTLRANLAIHLLALMAHGQTPPTPRSLVEGALGSWEEDLELVDVEETGEADVEEETSVRSVARWTAGRYRVHLEAHERCAAVCCEVAGPVGRGKSASEAVDALRAQLAEYAGAMLKRNQIPAEPLADVEARRKVSLGRELARVA